MWFPQNGFCPFPKRICGVFWSNGSRPHPGRLSPRTLPCRVLEQVRPARIPEMLHPIQGASMPPFVVIPDRFCSLTCGSSACSFTIVLCRGRGSLPLIPAIP